MLVVLTLLFLSCGISGSPHGGNKLSYNFCGIIVCYNAVILLPPTNAVAVLGGNFTFTCSVPSLVRYTTLSWLSNGSMLDYTRGQDTMVMLHPDAGISTLTFYNLSLQYNGSRIQCAAFDDSGIELSNEVTIQLIQG